MPVPPETQRNFKPYAIALAIVIAIILVVWFAAAHSSNPAGARDDAYAAQVTVAGVKVLRAESMMGGSVVYYRGQLNNRGDRTLTGYFVNLTFHDLYGKPIETVRRALLDQHVQPLAPHSTRDFEIGFDEFPSGWNQAPPTSAVAAVYVK